jgi:hypothetical protein
LYIEHGPQPLINADLRKEMKRYEIRNDQTMPHLQTATDKEASDRHGAV